MQEINLESKKIKVNFNGESYMIRPPTRIELVPVLKEMKNVSDDPEKSLDSAASLLVKVGLPKKVVDSLEIEHITMLFEAINSKKK